MPLLDDVKAHAKRVAKAIKVAKATEDAELARDFMAANPDALLVVIDLIHRAANRKKPNETVVQAYAFMFTSALEALRYHIEAGQDWANDLLDAVRESLTLLAKGEIIAPSLLMLLLNGFVEARLEPGDELTRLLGDLALDAADHEDDGSIEGLDSLFDTVAAEAGGNEFQVYAGLAEVSQTLPAAFRQAMLCQLVTADNPILRDTATLYLLDPSPDVRQALCQLLIENASPSRLSPAALRRMIALRNWLPESERPHLDRAIKTARQRKVECAPWPKSRKEDILVSNIDGAGAQSVFAVAKEGRKHVIASLLVKQGVGIADAWCMRDQSKADVRSLLAQIHAETESLSVEAGFLRLLIGHYLAVGLASGEVPNAGLLDFMESAGIETCQPAALAAVDLVSLMENDVEAMRLDSAGIDDIVQGSAGWPGQFEFMESWFEDDAMVEQVLAKRPTAKTPTKVRAIISAVLEPRRKKWAERFLWTALWLKQEKQDQQPWVAFFAIGRELDRDRPLAKIPVMQSVADLTVAARSMSLF